MEHFLKDISNRQQQAAATKTFERRRKAAACEEPQTPASDGTPETCSSSSLCSSSTPASSVVSRQDADDAVPTTTKSRSSTAFLRGARRSSILPAAALPGGQQYREAPASRSLMLQKMSRAKRKAYLTYMQQMAEYFAEVDEFELIEESPGAPTGKKTRPRAADASNTPAVSDSTPTANATAAAVAAAKDTIEGLSELHWQSPANVGSSLLATSPMAPADTDKRPQSQATIPPACSSSTASDTTQQQQQQLEEVQQEQEQDLLLLADTPAVIAPVLAAAAAAAPASALAHLPLACSPAALPSIEALAANTPCSGLNPPSSFAGTRSNSQRRMSRFAAEMAATMAATATGTANSAGASDLLPASAAQQLAAVDDSTAAAAAAVPLVVDNAAVGELTQQLHGLQVAKPADNGMQQQQQQQPADASLVAATPVQQQKQHEAVDDHDKTIQDMQQECRHPPLEHQMQQQQQQQEDVELLAQQWAQEAATEQLAQLQAAAAALMNLTPLQRMLQACGQLVDLQAIPSMKQFMADVTDLREVVKLGEGTYGEAFKAGQVVFKLVPMEGENLINGFPQKGAADLLAEAIIASTLSGLANECDAAGNPYSSHTKAFVQTHKVGVCRGPYPQPFIRAWKAWDKRNNSENDPIDGLPCDQLYACFAMANCGRDLEGYQLRDFQQARSMMLQVALALAVAEEALAFEHRDLHWGNVMLSPASSTYITCRLTGCGIRVRTEGAVVCLIDFTASRLQTPGGDVAFCDLEQEEGLFDGPKGKCQFETYRRMRKVTSGNWSGSFPGTNVQWMLYLCELLLSEKPVLGMTAANKRVLREFKKRVVGYSRCGEVIWDELFQGLWSVVD